MSQGDSCGPPAATAKYIITPSKSLFHINFLRKIEGNGGLERKKTGLEKEKWFDYLGFRFVLREALAMMLTPSLNNGPSVSESRVLELHI